MTTYGAPMRRVFAVALLVSLAACGGDEAEPFNEESLRAYIEREALDSATAADIEAVIGDIRELCAGTATERYIHVHTTPDGFDPDHINERTAEMLQIACPDALIDDDS